MKSVNTDIAYDYVRKRILEGEYRPGHALLTEVLASELNLSRTPIRDALRKLETDGLVTIQPHLGASVKTMGLKEFRETGDLRLALESHAAGMAAVNRTEFNLSEIRTALETMRRLTQEIGPTLEDRELIRELVQEDMRFHVGIITAAKNDVIKKEILRLHLINRVVMAGPPGLKQALSKQNRNERINITLMEHTQIFEAISNSDADQAKRAMESHLRDMIEYSVRVMTWAESGTIAHQLTPAELAYNTTMLEHMT
jgi:DNA-binding GntR family transcriptional regulator